MISDEMTGAETVAEQPVSAPGASVEGDAPTEAPKKRVGRPRKKPAASEEAESAAAADSKEESPAPAKRTARKKASTAEQSEEKPAPRRRARRSTKADAADSEAQASAENSVEKTASASAKTSDESAAAVEKKPSKTVSRSRKTASATEEKPVQDSVSRSGSASAQDDASHCEPASAQDGASHRESAPVQDDASRKEAAAARNAEAHDAASVQEEPREASSDRAVAPDYDAVEAKPALRKRPGRSTKLRMAVEASEAAAFNEEHNEASSEGTADKPADEKPARRRTARTRKQGDDAADERVAEGSEEESRNKAEDRGEERSDASSEKPSEDAPGNASDGTSGNADEGRERHTRRDRESRQPRDRRQNQRDRRQNSKQPQQSRDHDRDRDRSRNDRDRNDRTNDQHRRQRRSHMQTREPIAPKTTVEDLAKLKVAELREKAAELNLEVAGLKKAELVEKVYEAAVRAEGFIEVEGILDVLQDGYGFLRTKGYLPSENDVYVGLATIRRNGLRKGDYVKGQTRPARENEKYVALHQVITVNGDPVEAQGERVRFGDLTPVFPDDCLVMEHGKNTITARVIDLVSPIGKGQRGLIVSPPKAGKTTVLKDIAAAITANNPGVHLMCLLVDERPEEVTDMQRSIKGEVIASTFDMPTENHIAVSELVIERAKRLVERGEDVVVLLDSLTRLARAYNLAQPASGRILSGGVDSTALYPPKRFLGAARNIEGGGSLTILASALIETGSKMDEVIFEEFKGTGNMELKLDRYLADRRIFPAIDPVASGTRREDLLLDPQEAPLIWAVRRILSNMNSTERAMDMLIKSLKQTNDNKEFLLRTAKKAQGNRDSENMEL